MSTKPLSAAEELRQAFTAAMHEELKYLRYFYQAADFGPADGDVRYIINENYEGEIPEGYGEEE